MSRTFNIRQYLDSNNIPHYNVPNDVLDKVDNSVNDLIERVVGSRLRDPLKPLVTPGEFKGALTDFIQNSGLEQFYPPNDPVVQEISNNAANLLQDPNYPINDSTQILKVASVCLYQVALYCDDSLSMTQGNRIQTQITFAQRLASLIMPLKNGAINLRFINAATQPAWDKMTSADAVAAAVRGVPYTGYTPIGTQLQAKILQPMLLDKLPAAGKLKGVAPLMILCITDGWPYNEPTQHFRDVCDAAKKTLAKFGSKPAKNALKIQLNQIGDDPQATEFLQGLKDDTDLKDNLYLTAEKLDAKFQELQNNQAGLDTWLTETVSRVVKAP